MQGHRKDNSTGTPATSSDGNRRTTDPVRLPEGGFARWAAHYRMIFRDTPYYSSGRYWSDYAPAYRYGHHMHGEHRGHRFEEVEDDLAEHWEALKGDSHLAWTEARGAVHDIWRRLDDVHPGDRDRMP